MRRARALGDRVTSLPLRWQIGTLVLLGLVAIFVLVGALGRAIADDAKQRTVSEWSSIARSTATVIDSEIDLQYERLEQIGAMLGGVSRDPAVQARVLDGAATGIGALAQDIVLLGPDRTVAWPRGATAATEAVTSDAGVLDPLRTGRRYASGVRAVRGGPAVILAVPIDSGGATAVLALLDRPAAGIVGDLVSSARGLAHTGHAELVDQYDRVIVSSDPGDALARGEHPDLYEPHLSHRTSGVGLTEPVGAEDPADQGQRHDMAFVSLRSVPWGLALGGNDAELSADAARWQDQIAGIGILSLFVALLLVWITTRSVARPVLALAAASRQIAAGDLTTPVPLGGEGEVRVLAQAFDHMRRELQSALSQLAVEKSRYEGIVTSMADAVVTADLEGRITELNPAAAALTGWSVDDALGRPIADVVPVQVEDRQGNGRARGGATKGILRRRDGHPVDVATTRSATRGSGGRPVGTVHVLRDVSAEAEVDRLKEEFLATVSHELRTPLGFIMGYSTTLLLPDAPDDPATRRRCIEVIAQASNELKQLVDDLLDMTKIGSGSLSVSPAPIRLGPLVDAAIDRIRSRDTAHSLVSDIPSDLPAIRADARRIEQILYNLLDNATKYSPEGGVITVRAEPLGRDVVVSVLDEGLGVPTDELTSIFERFHRGHLARTRGIAGTGLGLAICKGIVDAHGGRIWAESPRTDGGRSGEAGTKISFTLPVAVDSRPRLDDASPGALALQAVGR